MPCQPFEGRGTGLCISALPLSIAIKPEVIISFQFNYIFMVQRKSSLSFHASCCLAGRAGAKWIQITYVVWKEPEAGSHHSDYRACFHTKYVSLYTGAGSIQTRIALVSKLYPCIFGCMQTNALHLWRTQKPIRSFLQHCINVTVSTQLT